ncbi:MAG: pirin family protein [Deltaproteobacteria bacterium]|nr:pirin family protein [Deltaproteobacteria bacterium]
MIITRNPENIYHVHGDIMNGTFDGRWHFSFGNYYDPENTRFGTLRVLNDDILSPGATWPLHPHHDIEVVTYCAGGEFRHADEHGAGGILKKGDVQHTTVGHGMWHSEINNKPDKPMRFIQMWFYPSKPDLMPRVEQRPVDKKDRTNKLLPLVSPINKFALPIASDARVFASFLQKGKKVYHTLEENRGAYVYVLEGGEVEVNSIPLPVLGAAKITDENNISIKAVKEDTEILLVDVRLVGGE